MIIDPPTPFSPLSEWREFLNELKLLEPETQEDKDDVEYYIAQAKTHIIENG